MGELVALASLINNVLLMESKLMCTACDFSQDCCHSQLVCDTTNDIKLKSL